MILNPTVLILGAGASYPYGYPLGAQLVQAIVHLTAPGAGLAGLLSSEPDVGEFHKRLGNSDVASIDDFLESNPMFASLGKLCIAAALTVWGPTHDYARQPDTDWYRYLWGRLHEGASTTEQFQRNRVRIITYNYDRSFERYFARVLTNAYPDLAAGGEAAAASFLATVLPIVHLHGTLGEADDLVRPAADRSPFLAVDFFRRAAAGIRIVHEDHPSDEYEAAHAWLREGRAVHLLGFGYHATNVRRLDLVTQSQNSPGWTFCGGTALGLENAERTRAEVALQLGMGILTPHDCRSYLRVRAPLE